MKTKNFLFLLCLLASTMQLRAQSLSDSPANWMSQLPDNLYITQLLIPGAHDAATKNCSTGWHKTQSLTIEEQWDNGVRVFDLRPTDENENGPIYHGAGLLRSSTERNFREVLASLKDKLNNSGEFAIIIFRNENNTGQDEGKWKNVIKPIIDSFNDVLVEWNPNLRLGDVRGKILALARDEVQETKAAKIWDWGDNKKDMTAYINDTGIYPVHVQDFYNDQASDAKKDAITAMLNSSMTSHSPNIFYINLVSASGSVTNTPSTIAQALNKYTYDLLASPADHPTGIIMMDYAGDDSNNRYGAKLVNRIIDQNNVLLSCNFSGPAGDYFLQNVETGQWVQGYQAIADASRDRWNTSANMGSYGRPFLLQDPGNDGWTLNTQAGDEKLNCEYAGDGLLSLDFGYAGGPTRWKITGPKDMAYITVNHDRWLSVDDTDLLINNGTTRNAWKLWTRDERLAAMSTATEANPQDVTWLMVNPELMNKDHIQPQWIISRDGGGDGWQDGFRPNRIYETWNYTSMDFYQTITVPNGKYEVQAYALFSPTEGGGTNINDYNDYEENGDATVNGYLYANDAQVKLPSIYSFTSPTPVADYAAKDLGGVSIVDGWWQAARAMGEDGKFHSQPLRVDVADGSLRLGIKETNNTSPFKSHWIIIGSFSLKYLGALDNVIEALRNTLQYLINDAFTGNTTDVLQSEYDAAVAAAQAALDKNPSENTEEELNNLITTLRDALNAARAVDDTTLEQTIAVAAAEGVNTTAAAAVTANGTTVDEVNNALEALRMSRKQFHFERDNATYNGHAPFKGKFYLYNVGQKNYLTSGSDWGTHLTLGWPGLELTATADGDGYKFQFQELNDQARNQAMTADYVDGETGWAVKYVFEPIDGKPGVYALRNGDKYLSFDPEAVPDDRKYFDSVTSFIPNKNSEDAQWMIVTKEDRLAEMDKASEDNPVDVTVLIRDASFNKFADLNNPWNDLNQGWWYDVRMHGDKNTQTQTTEGYDLSQTITVPRAGFYKVSVQSYYRDGDIGAYITSVQNEDPLVAAPTLYAQINGVDVATQPIKYLHEDADKAPGEGTATAIGNIPDGGEGLYQASKFFENGLYKNETAIFEVNEDNTEIKIGVKKPAGDREGNWVVTDNFRLTYLGGWLYDDETGNADVRYLKGKWSNDKFTEIDGVKKAKVYNVQNVTSIGTATDVATNNPNALFIVKDGASFSKNAIKWDATEGNLYTAVSPIAFTDGHELNTSVLYNFTANQGVTYTRPNVNMQNYATVVVPFGAPVPDGFKAYGIAAEEKNGEFFITFRDASSLEAGKPYLLRPVNPTAGTQTMTIAVGSGESKTVAFGLDNTMTYARGTYSFMTRPDGTNYYGVSSSPATEDHIKLSKLSANGKISPFRIYFEVPATSNGKINITFEEATGIRQATTEEIGRLFDIYSVNGQIVKKNSDSTLGLPAGVYIVNGKKVVIK